jgi:hypothetical protein
MVESLAGRNGEVFIASAARTPIGLATRCRWGGGSVAMAVERVAA